MPQLSLTELSDWCQTLISKFSDKQIVLLSGPLGAGKTQLVKSIVEKMGGSETSSPTFSLINEYEHPSRKIIHCDLYRIESEEDLESTGFWDLFDEPALIFIEWPEKMDTDQLPRDWSRWTICIKKEESDFTRTYCIDQ